MFDEPFVGQDHITMGVLVKLISELNSALGVTCIVVSHDVPEVLSIADYAYIVADKEDRRTRQRRSASGKLRSARAAIPRWYC